MSEQNTSWEADLRKTAASFSYPPTPDVAAGVRQRLAPSEPRRVNRRLAYALVLLLILAGLLAVPPVRAALVSIFRAGAVTIFVGQPTLTPETSSAAATAVNTPSPLAEQLAGLAEPVTLAQAQSLFVPQLQIPAALGEPNEVWLHEGLWYTAVIFLWRDDARPPQITYSLYQIDAEQYASKGAERVEEVAVNGYRGFWLEGPHYFQLRDDSLAPWQFVPGSVLLWWAEDRTYRLEGARSLAEATQIASSITPVCPVTQPPDPPFVPPKPWPARPPEPDQFWFGDAGLWTALPVDGNWRQLALGEKFWWWSADFDVTADSTPALTITARRLDGPAPPLRVTEATNGYHESFHWAMLTGVELASPGCWAFTAEYRNQQLSFVLWVPSE